LEGQPLVLARTPIGSVPVDCRFIAAETKCDYAVCRSRDRPVRHSHSFVPRNVSWNVDDDARFDSMLVSRPSSSAIECSELGLKFKVGVFNVDPGSMSKFGIAYVLRGLACEEVALDFFDIFLVLDAVRRCDIDWIKCAKSLKRNQSRIPSTVDTGSGTAFLWARANSRCGVIAPIKCTCSSTFGIERMKPSSDTAVPFRPWLGEESFCDRLQTLDVLFETSRSSQKQIHPIKNLSRRHKSLKSHS
jgi:hypothetical protein